MTRTRTRLLAALSTLTAVPLLTTPGAAPAAANPATTSVVARPAAPATTPPTARRVYAPGTSISQLDSTQVLVADRVAGTRGTWARWSWNGSRWVKVNAPAGAVFGRGGVVPAAVRRQGTGTTPAGAFTLVSAFGKGNPGTRMAYRTVTACSWWIQDPRARDYNRWRQSCAVPRATAAGSERLSTYVASGLYRQAVVVGYNYWNVRRYGSGSGAGIFLHHARRYTGGCVGIDDMAELTATVRWLDPARHPVLVIKA
ncbi:L,D-transpeptidase family protein [Arsenicicoccus dermatophilus]|uniref:L,D-transpeptidase family protein n=1 Tax=Arsenicicoccus dermatophilus TaxID=1076331 RepID=UPI003917394D